LLARVPEMTSRRAAAIVERFGELARLQRASIAELQTVPGIDEAQATAIKDTLDRLTESSILDQYS
jgi:diadenylate cyclase